MERPFSKVVDASWKLVFPTSDVFGSLFLPPGEVSIDDPNFWQKVLPSFQTFENLQKDLSTEDHLKKFAVCFAAGVLSQGSFCGEMWLYSKENYAPVCSQS